MISLDLSILYQVVIFVFLWLILSRILFRPYLKLLEEREHKTSGALHESHDLDREGERLKLQYEEKIAQAQSAGNAVKEAILQQARQQRERILTEAREEATRSLEAVRQEVQKQLEEERRLAAAEAAGLGREMASKILGRSLV
jgi:F-type H+-transporting ATPase subunit b